MRADRPAPATLALRGFVFVPTAPPDLANAYFNITSTPVSTNHNI